MIVIFDNEEQKNNFINNVCPAELGYIPNPICLESCKECLSQYVNMYVINQEEQKELIIKTKTEINIALQNAIMELGYEPYNEKTEKLYKTIESL